MSTLCLTQSSCRLQKAAVVGMPYDNGYVKVTVPVADCLVCSA